MYKRGIFLLTSVMLLGACGGEANETEADDATADETEVENIENQDQSTDNSTEAKIDSNLHNFNGLVNETTFTEEYGLQAWEDYQAIIEDTTLGEITLLNEEDINYEDLNGTTIDEIQERIDSMEIREDVFQDEVELSEEEKLVFYRYPPATDSEYGEVADFLAELTFYYADDNLMFSSITPGFYSVELDNLPAANDLMMMMSVSEIEEINPRIYTIAEMQINGEKIQQVMTPAMEVNEEGSEEMMAFYFFTKGEDILQYAYLPFEMVSQDFPTNSILLFYQLIPELEKL